MEEKNDDCSGTVEVELTYHHSQLFDLVNHSNIFSYKARQIRYFMQAET
jgi:hypothetical protein